MAHYAVLDENNVVVSVFVGKHENETANGVLMNWEDYYKAKRTSYNTRGGVHHSPETAEPSPDQSKAFRKNFAAIGFQYDAQRDAFIPPKPYPSWILNEQTCLWEAPTANPNDGQRYKWDEDTTSWRVLEAQ